MSIAQSKVSEGMAASTAEVPAQSGWLSGGEALKLYQESSAAQTNKSIAEHRALAAAANPKEEVALHETTAILPTDSAKVKLEKLRQIDEASDYSGMSYEEIYTDLWNRYNQAFDGNLAAILSDLCIGPSYWIDASNQFREAEHQYIIDPRRMERKAAGLDCSNAQEWSDIRSAPFGYGGMSFAEKEAAILRKYRGKNTLMDFLNMQGELLQLGVLDDKIGRDGAYMHGIDLSGKVSKHLYWQWENSPIKAERPYGVSETRLFTEAMWDRLLNSSFDINHIPDGSDRSSVLEGLDVEDFSPVGDPADQQIDELFKLLDRHQETMAEQEKAEEMHLRNEEEQPTGEEIDLA